MDNSEPAAALAAVRAGIEAACRAARRGAASVRLVAVSKAQPAGRIAALADAGQHEFGENYVQEALAKIAALRGRGLTWHFIGPLQSNKTAEVAANFDWVQSVDREKIARRLAEQRPGALPPLNVCVQVNISGEASKSGVAPRDAEALCRTVASLPRLRLRGLMAIPAPTRRAGESRGPETLDPGLRQGDEAHRALRELFDDLRRRGFELDTLSAGMSDDYPQAIAHGATHVRIGTALFGPRPP